MKSLFIADLKLYITYNIILTLKHNFGYTTDNFNKAHLSFLKDYFVNDNSEDLPFCFNYIAYKPGTDILTESQQYQLCLEFLDLGYKVYVSDDLLKDKCDARILFGVPDEKVYRIDL